MNGKLILSPGEIPDEEKDPQLYAAAESPALKGVLVFQIINEIRKYDPEQLTNRACALQLAKLKAMTEGLDLLSNIHAITTKEENTTEEIP